MRNNNKENTINQVKSKEDFLSDLKSLTKTQKNLLNHFIQLRSVFKNLFPSQTTLAASIDSGRTYINECVQVLESLGFISTTYYHRTSKSYKISSLFSNPFYRSIAIAILPALVSFPIYSILSLHSPKTDTITYKNLFKDFSYCTDTKIMTSDDQIFKKRETLKQERLKRERLTTNVHKLFYDPEYPGDIYEAKNHKREVRKPMSDNEAQPKFNQNPVSTKSNVSAYKKWEPEVRTAENPSQAFLNMTKNNFMNSPEWDKFVRLMGKEEAIKWFEAGLKQSTREQ